MSVPLDRLYTFLEGLCDHDMLIYHFFPDGSKNIINCLPHGKEVISKPMSFSDFLRIKALVFHDQEPLNFELLSNYNPNFKRPADVPLSPFRGRLHGYDYFNVYDKTLLCHSELNSNELKKFEESGCIGVYYWAHALIARDWYRYAKHDQKLLSDRHPTKTFLIYNRAWTGTREYRLFFTELLANNNLINHCKMRFNPSDNGCHYTSHKFVNRDLQISRFDFENFFPINNSDPSSSADFVIEDYVTTEVEVVLETLFDDQRNHLTEKSLRPIACGQPFILVSTPNSLKYLHRYGFKTFEEVFDESYDAETDPKLRLEKIVSTMKSINNLSTADKNKLREIAHYNRLRFFSDEFSQLLVDEFTENLNSALSEMTKHCKASFLKFHENFNNPIWRPSTMVRFKNEQEYRDLMSWVNSQAQDLTLEPSQSSGGGFSLNSQIL